MRRALVLGLATAAALALAAPALAAYRPQLLVTPQGSLSPQGTRLHFEQRRDDDATARVEIAVPAAYRVTLGQAPGTLLGAAEASVTVRGFDVGAIPVSGRTVVADPAPYSFEAAACGVVPVAVWRVGLSAQTGQTLGVTLFVEVSGAAVRVVACLPSPEVPEEVGGAPFGVKLLSATLTVAGVFAAPRERGRHVWSARFTPYAAGTAVAGTAVEARAVVSVPARVTLARRAVRGRVVLSGRLLEAGAGVRGVGVELWEARSRSGGAARRVARARTGRNGAFSLRRTVTRTRWYAVLVPARDTTARDCAASPAPGGCVRALGAPLRSAWLRVPRPRRR